MIGDPSPQAGRLALDGQQWGGRVIAAAASPDGQRVYASTSYGGLWRSDDSGTTFRQLTRPQPGDGASVCPPGISAPCGLPPLTITDVAVWPRNPDLVFAATALDPRSRQTRNGVYRSQDGGETWSLVHQFHCLLGDGSLEQDSQPVSQLAFAPEDDGLLYAAAGCAVAVSSAGVVDVATGLARVGMSWTDSPRPNASGRVWRVAVGRLEANGVRRVWGCGSEVWYSSNGGATFLSTGSSACTAYGITGGPAQVAVDPGDPSRAWFVFGIASNGLSFFDPSPAATRIPDGQPCGTTLPNGTATTACGQTGLWSLSVDSGLNFSWQRESSPPVYWGNSYSHSGAGGLTIVSRAGRPSLILVYDRDALHVSEMPPSPGSWHRLDGPDVSESCRPGGTRCNGSGTVAVDTAGHSLHADPRVVVATPRFDLTLSAPPSTVPAAYRQVRELAGCGGGNLFYGNDGGLYSSSDCGRTWRLASNLTGLGAQQLAGFHQPGRLPVLYFGCGDNDAWISKDGGAHWTGGVGHCSDCGGYFTDPLLPGYVMHQSRDSTLRIFARADHAPPDIGADAFFDVPLPQGAVFGANNTYSYMDWYHGWTPFVRALPGESAHPALVQLAPDVTATPVLPRLYRMETPARDALTWTATGPTLPLGVTVVQAAGGLNATRYYAADRAVTPPALYPDDKADTQQLYRSRHGSDGGIVSWERIVPGVGAGPAVARAFFSDPYNAQILYVEDDSQVWLSTDGGSTFHVARALSDLITDGGQIGGRCILAQYCSFSDERRPFTGVTFVPDEPRLRFATGAAGVFFTADGALAGESFDDGAGAPATRDHWHRLLDPAALACNPGPGFFDKGSPLGRVYYVPCSGRSLISFIGIPPAEPL